MYCGKMKKEFKGITLRDVLKEIPDSLLDAKLVVLNNDHVYLHFDIEGGNVNLDTRPWDASYDCNGCDKNINKKCTCDGSNCMNYVAYFTAKENILKDTISNENDDGIVVYNPKDNNVVMTINGVQIVESDEPISFVDEDDNALQLPKEESLDNMIKTSIIDALTNVINTLKGENK